MLAATTRLNLLRSSRSVSGVRAASAWAKVPQGVSQRGGEHVFRNLG